MGVTTGISTIQNDQEDVLQSPPNVKDSLNKKQIVGGIRKSVCRRNSNVLMAEKVELNDYISDLPNDLSMRYRHKNAVRNQLMTR